MAVEVTSLIGQLEIVTDEDRACYISRGIVQFIKSRPGDKVVLTEKAILNCAQLLKNTVNNKLRCLLFSVLASCWLDAGTVKLYIRSDILKPLMRTLQHLIKTPWKQGGMNKKCQEEILLDQALSLIHRIVSAIDVEKDAMCIEDLIKEGVINRLMDLLDDKDSPLFQYSETARESLEDLILRKHLVGQVTVWDESAVIDFCQKFVVRGSSKLSLSCCKSGKQVTHLYDTTCPDVDLDVQNELISFDVVWPLTNTDINEKDKEKGACAGDASSSHESDSSDSHPAPNNWIDIYPVHIEDGGHFWAQIGGEETLMIVDKIQTKLSQFPDISREYLKKEPGIGSFICAVNKKYYDGPLIFRGIVLEVNGNMASIFALDYGFRCEVPFNELCYLSGKMNVGGIPPQAVLCALQEIQPCPVSNECLKKILAVLCCILAFQPSVNIFLDKGGLQVLHRLCSVPDLTISCMAMANVSNITRFFFMRQKIAATKFLHLFIRRCAGIDPRSPDQMQIQLLQTALGAMKNMMFNCLEARNKFLEQGGPEVVMTIARKADNKILKGHALGLMKVLLGSGCYEEKPVDEDTIMSAPSTQKTDELLLEEKRPETQRESRNFQRRYSTDKNRSRSRPSLGREASLGRDRRRNSSSDEETPDRPSGCGAASGDDTDGETIIQGKLNSPVANVKVDIIAVNAALMDDANVSYYIHGRKVVFANDEFHDIRPTQDIKLASTNTLAKIMCSLRNNGKGGSIFYGIGKNREVFGIALTRDQKDSFRLGVDRMMVKFIPTIFHQQHDLMYCPVVDAIGYDHIDTRRHIPDLYIIEIKLEKQTSTLYTLSDRKCYFRYGTNTVQVSTQEIRQRAILQEESRYRDEIDMLKKELISLRQMH